MANLSFTAANAELAGLAPLMNGGLIQVFSGPMPANANTPLSSTNTLLVTFGLPSPAFGPPITATITAQPIPQATAVATALPSFARIYQNDGMTVVMDLTAGGPGSGAEVLLSAAAIIGGASVSCLAFTYTIASSP
jgi:hypothetical protein